MCTTHNVKTHETTVYIFTTVNSHTSELYRLFGTKFVITSHVVEEFKNGAFINNILYCNLLPARELALSFPCLKLDGRFLVLFRVMDPLDSVVKRTDLLKEKM